MPKILLRNFRNNDLEAVCRLNHLAFSDPNLQDGGTPEAGAYRLRSLTSMRMRVLTGLFRYRLEMIVAEVDGNVAGFVMLTGRDRVNMNTLMVDPQYRRCGVGATLVEETSQRAQSLGYPFVTAEVLTTNLPSAKLCEKLGFQVYDTFTIYETPLPLSQPAEYLLENRVAVRPVRAGEQSAFAVTERTLVSAVDLHVRGSAIRFYYPSLYRQLVDRREHKQYQALAVEKDGQRVGFQYLHSGLGNQKGTLTRPILPDAHLNFLPSILVMAGDWFSELGKHTLRIEVPADRPHLIENLFSWNWQPSVEWLCLVKWLDNGH
jgi:ribosomal protein S18 acetylase RimI-like enzyme